MKMPKGKTLAIYGGLGAAGAFVLWLAMRNRSSNNATTAASGSALGQPFFLPGGAGGTTQDATTGSNVAPNAGIDPTTLALLAGALGLGGAGAGGAGGTTIPPATARNWGANPTEAMAEAQVTGYTGDFGGGKFLSWLATQSPSIQQAAAAIDAFYTGSTATTGGSNGSGTGSGTAKPPGNVVSRNWGNPAQVAENKALAQATGYGGDFGGGAFATWLAGQGFAVRQAAYRVDAQFADTSVTRGGFGTGANNLTPAKGAAQGGAAANAQTAQKADAQFSFGQSVKLALGFVGASPVGLGNVAMQAGRIQSRLLGPIAYNTGIYQQQSYARGRAAGVESSISHGTGAEGQPGRAGVGSSAPGGGGSGAPTGGVGAGSSNRSY